MKTSDIAQERITHSTVQNAMDRMAYNQPTKDKKRSGRLTSWTAAYKTKLKRLSDHRTGVSQTRLGEKFGVHQTTIELQTTCIGHLSRLSWTSKSTSLYRATKSLEMQDKSKCLDLDRLAFPRFRSRHIQASYSPIEVQSHQFRHLHQRVLSEKATLIHPRASSRLQLHFLARL